MSCIKLVPYQQPATKPSQRIVQLPPPPIELAHCEEVKCTHKTTSPHTTTKCTEEEQK